MVSIPETYVAEIVRSGIMSIDKGQMEAGRSLGLSSGQTMKLIIMPQALKMSSGSDQRDDRAFKGNCHYRIYRHGRLSQRRPHWYRAVLTALSYP